MTVFQRGEDCAGHVKTAAYVVGLEDDRGDGPVFDGNRAAGGRLADQPQRHRIAHFEMIVVGHAPLDGELMRTGHRVIPFDKLHWFEGQVAHRHGIRD